MNLGPYLLGPNDTPENGIYIGDARELAKAIPDESIDLIFTDPPYLKEYLPLYDWLSNQSRLVKDTGFLFMYTGGYWKDEVMSYFRNSGWEYFWDYTVGMPGNNSLMWPRKTIARAKSILCYRPVTGHGMPRYNVLDLWIGSAQDKRFHTWGQEESAARYYIESFTTVEQVVLDPFAGGGTSAAMAKVLGRKYLSFEIIPFEAQNARSRIKKTQPPLPIEMPTQEVLL